MDLTVSPNFYLETLPLLLPVNPSSQRDIDAMFTDKSVLPYDIPSGERILLSTQEKIKVPQGCVGIICLRSTWARLGLISPPTVADPGFEGTLTMEIFNASNHSLLIQPGVAMWSIHYLALFAYDTPAYQGKYQGQDGVTPPKAI